MEGGGTSGEGESALSRKIPRTAEEDNPKGKRKKKREKNTWIREKAMTKARQR